MKTFLEKNYRALGFVGALAAIIIAVTYYKIIPAEVTKVDGVQEIILRYGHSFCWILLSQASLLWGLRGTYKWSKYLAYAALVTYIIFIVTLLITKFT